MAKKLTDKELERILYDFLKNLEGKISIDRSVLFGSYAKGTAHEWSDIDLMIVSGDLPLTRPKGANGFQLMKMAGLDHVYPGLEIIGVHPEKISHPVTKSFFDEIFNTGKEFDLGTKSLIPMRLTSNSIL